MLTAACCQTYKGCCPCLSSASAGRAPAASGARAADAKLYCQTVLAAAAWRQQQGRADHGQPEKPSSPNASGSVTVWAVCMLHPQRPPKGSLAPCSAALSSQAGALIRPAGQSLSCQPAHGDLLPAELTCEQVILICSFSSHSRRKSIITCRAASISLTKTACSPAPQVVAQHVCHSSPAAAACCTVCQLAVPGGCMLHKSTLDMRRTLGW